MYGEPDVWHALMEKLTATFALYLAAHASSRRRRDPALRLVGRGAFARRLREFVAPYSAQVLAAVDVPTIHFGTGTTTPARGDGRSRRRRDRRRLAASPSTAAGRSSARSAGSRGTSIRRCCSGRGSGSRPRRCGSWSPSAAGRATSSTSVTECCRRPTRAISRRLVEPCTRTARSPRDGRGRR